MIRRILLALGLLAGVACGPPEPRRPDERGLWLPTGIATDPQGRWLFVTQGNLDHLKDYSLLAAYDLGRIEAWWNMTQPAPECQASPNPARGPLCPIGVHLVDQAWTLLPSGAGNIAFDAQHNQPWGRLFVPTRHRSAVVWLDLQTHDAGGLQLACGQGQSRVCGDDHILDAVEFEPARIYLDDQGFDFAYLPHLLQGRMSLLSRSGPKGPALVDQKESFFEAVTVESGERGGGFGLAQIPCDASSGYAPAASRNCTRPVVYAGQRFIHGLQAFSVAPGRKVMLTGPKVEFGGGEPDQTSGAKGWPATGALWVSPLPEPRLFVVQHEPPMLLSVDLRLNGEQRPRNELLDAVPLCDRADMLTAISGPMDSTRLLVACPARGQLWVIDPQAMRRVGVVQVGQGANEMWLQADKQRLWVVNTGEHSISAVDVDPASPSYLRERLRLRGSL